MIQPIKYECWFKGEEEYPIVIETRWGPEDAAEKFVENNTFEADGEPFNGWDVYVSSPEREIQKFNVISEVSRNFLAVKR